MRKLLLTATVIATLPLMAFADSSGDATALSGMLPAETALGTSMDAVRQALEGKGLTVRKMEMEDGQIEAYVVHGSAMAEVLVDPASGMVVGTKIK